MADKLANYGDPVKLNLALKYLLNRNQQKYGGGGLFGAFLDAINNAFNWFILNTNLFSKNLILL